MEAAISSTLPLNYPTRSQTPSKHSAIIQRIRNYPSSFRPLLSSNPVTTLTEHTSTSTATFVQSGWYENHSMSDEGSGCGTLLLSGNQLSLVLRAGVDPKRIIFKASGEFSVPLLVAAHKGVFVTVESALDLINIKKAARLTGKVVPVVLLVDLDVDSQVLPHASMGNETFKVGIRNEKLQRFINFVKLYRNKVKLRGAYCRLGMTMIEVDIFGDAAPLLNYIDEIRVRSSEIKYLTVGGGLGINHYLSGIIPPTLMDLNNIVDIFGDAANPLRNYIDEIRARSSEIKYLTVGDGLGIYHYHSGTIPPPLMDLNNTVDIFGDAANPLLNYIDEIRAPSEINYLTVGGSLGINHYHSRINPPTLMDLNNTVDIFGDAANPLLNYINEIQARSSEIKYLTVGGGLGINHYHSGIIAPILMDLNNIFRRMWCSHQILWISLLMAGSLLLFDPCIRSIITIIISLIHSTDRNYIKLDTVMSLMQVFLAKTKAVIQNHGEGKYNDQLHVRFDPVISSLESVLLTITCKPRAKDDDEYKYSMSDLQLIVEGVIKDEQLFYGETWPVQPFVCV